MRARASARLDGEAQGPSASRDGERPGLRADPALAIRLRNLLPLVALLLVALLSPRSNAAPVIPAGQEERIVGLFAPFGLGDEVTPGCELESVVIEPVRIEVTARVDGGTTGRLVLDPPSVVPGEQDLPSFSVTIVADDGHMQRCLGGVRDAALDNDDGLFWQTIAVAASDGDRTEGSDGANADDDRTEATDGTNGDGGAELPWTEVPISPHAQRLIDDGLLRFAVFVLVLLVVLGVSVRRDGAWILGALVVISVGAWGIRAWLSPEVAMAPWPYSRVISPARMAMQGQLLSSLFPGGIGVCEVIFGSVWTLALLAPVAVYLHGRYLLGDPRRALAAAILIAALPLHIRFSRSDTAFIPSITTTALVFVLIHIATREPRVSARLLALCLLPGAMVLMFEIRPLNIMYMPLMLGTCVIRGWSDLDKRWVVVAAAVVSGVTFGIGLPQLLQSYSREVHEGLSFAVLANSLGVLVDWEYDILLNPFMTPTGVLALAVFGGWSLYRSQEKRVLAFLVVWLLMFLVAHAYVVPSSPAMQARYHLHLVTPFIMLAGCGLAAVRSGPWRKAIVAYVLATPVIHASFITDTGYNDMREFQFVRQTAEHIHDGCTVLEYTGEYAGEARYHRLTAVVRGGMQSSRLRSVQTFDTGIADGSDDPLVPEVRELIAQPPACTYLYVGLACEGLKAPDEDLHPACEALMRELPLELVAEARHPSRPYDGNYRHGYAHGHPDHAHFRLFRVVGAVSP